MYRSYTVRVFYSVGKNKESTFFLRFCIRKSIDKFQVREMLYRCFKERIYLQINCSKHFSPLSSSNLRSKVNKMTTKEGLSVRIFLSPNYVAHHDVRILSSYLQCEWAETMLSDKICNLLFMYLPLTFLVYQYQGYGKIILSYVHCQVEKSWKRGCHSSASKVVTKSWQLFLDRGN